MSVIDVLQSPWAIIPERLAEYADIYSAHLQRGGQVDLSDAEARLGRPLENRRQGYDVRDGVAVIPIEGVIAKKMNMLSKISGGASTQLIERDFNSALAANDVHTIVLHADTPGGTVDGTAELAETIFKARGRKKIIALADGLMASAGVWIGSAADEIYITSGTTHVGSIGVVTQHIDYSERYKQHGIKVTEVYAGKYKRISSQYKPLSKAGRENLQESVDYLYSLFVDAVAKHRGTAPSDVLERMADGRMFIGQRAIDAGLVDGIKSLDQVIAESRPSDAAPVGANANGVPTLEDRWRSDANLRAEFCGDFSLFEAYENRHETRANLRKQHD